MWRFIVLAGLLSGFISTRAEAKTVLYEFDVVASMIEVGVLYESDIPSNGVERRIAHDDPLYREVVLAIHPLGHLMGQTGRISVQLSGDMWWQEMAFVDSIDCLSGFLCSDLDRLDGNILGHPSSSFGPTGFDIFAYGANPSGEWYLKLPDSVAGTGGLSFTDDLPSGNARLYGKGKEYWHDGARALFTLANVKVTDLTVAPAPVPLPATAWFLGIGILVLNFQTRRGAV